MAFGRCSIPNPTVEHADGEVANAPRFWDLDQLLARKSRVFGRTEGMDVCYPLTSRGPCSDEVDESGSFLDAMDVVATSLSHAAKLRRMKAWFAYYLPRPFTSAYRPALVRGSNKTCRLK
jgi:hypothetical protein